jgi:hypothetical protein
MDKMFRLTITANDPDEAKEEAVKWGANHVISIKEVKKVYEAIIIKTLKKGPDNETNTTKAD